MTIDINKCVEEVLEDGYCILPNHLSILEITWTVSDNAMPFMPKAMCTVAWRR